MHAKTMAVRVAGMILTKFDFPGKVHFPITGVLLTATETDTDDVINNDRESISLIKQTSFFS